MVENDDNTVQARKLPLNETGGARLLPSGRLGCLDCAVPYASTRFPDLVIDHAAWRAISPKGDDGGLLCPNCISARLEAAGLKNVRAVFRSGPMAVHDSDTPDADGLTARVRELDKAATPGPWKVNGAEPREIIAPNEPMVIVRASPAIYVHAAHANSDLIAEYRTLAQPLASALAEARAELERERLRLATVGVAAHGGDVSGCAPEYDSDALQAVLAFRAELTALRQDANDAAIALAKVTQERDEARKDTGRLDHVLTWLHNHIALYKEGGIVEGFIAHRWGGDNAERREGIDIEMSGGAA